MARIIPYAAIQFSAHEQWKRFLLGNGNGKIPVQYEEIRRFIAGSLAGVTAQSLTYPLDLTRARMAVTSKEQYSSLSSVLVKIYRDEGLLTLYRGYCATMIGVIPYAGVGFYVYELCKRLHKKYFFEDKTNDFSQYNGPSALERLAFGACAGAFGQTCGYPLDIVRRRLQVNDAAKLKVIQPEGRFRIIRMMTNIAR